MSSVDPTAEESGGNFGKFEQAMGTLEAFIDKDYRLSSKILEAKENFIELTGKIRETSPSYESRINAFLEWFIFDYNLSRKPPHTPIAMYIARLKTQKNLIELEYYTALSKQLHSLFSLVKVAKTHAEVKDLYTDKKYILSDPQAFLGFEKKSIFETRLFPVEDHHRLGLYVIKHPQTVYRQIIAQLKKLKKSKQLKKDFIFQLQQYYCKWETYQHIDIRSIYHLDDRFPEAK